MLRRIAGGAIALVAVLAAYGCGSSASDTSIGTGTHGRSAALVPAADSAVANGLRTVTYQGVAFDVPADWPVYDLAADRSTCVRFDVHAVYLGEPGSDMNCPAGLVGHADALLVEPAKRDGKAPDDHAADGASVSTATGLQVQVATDPAASALEATVPSAGLDVTLTYQDTDATVQQILQSFRAVAR